MDTPELLTDKLTKVAAYEKDKPRFALLKWQVNKLPARGASEQEVLHELLNFWYDNH
jgi:hypothetical protein